MRPKIFHGHGPYLRQGRRLPGLFGLPPHKAQNLLWARPISSSRRTTYPDFGLPPLEAQLLSWARPISSSRPTTSPAIWAAATQDPISLMGSAHIFVKAYNLPGCLGCRHYRPNISHGLGPYLRHGRRFSGLFGLPPLDAQLSHGLGPYLRQALGLTGLFRLPPLQAQLLSWVRPISSLRPTTYQAFWAAATTDLT